MLAQILPGFRDFRTPLLTGYLWLVLLWVLLGQRIPSPETTHGIVGLVNAAASYLSPAAYLAVLSFVAYTLGILASISIETAANLVLRFGFTTERSHHDKLWKGVTLFPLRTDPTYERALSKTSTATLSEVLQEAMHRLEKRNVPWYRLFREYGKEVPEEVDYNTMLHGEYGGDPGELNKGERSFFLRELLPGMISEVARELPALAIKLQDKNPALYSSYDRDRSEAEFRLSIALPIAALSLQVWWLDVTDTWWVSTLAMLLGLVAAGTLLRKGWLKVLSASSVVVTALEIGTIQSQVIQRLDDIPGSDPTELGEAIS